MASKKGKPSFTDLEINRIIEMAWEDRTPFSAIEAQFGINEAATISLMRSEMKESSFKMWRKRMSGRKTKHIHLGTDTLFRFKCSMQKGISMNKIAKR
jgi:uncharacterized protein (TIGR03643 family)